jgi:methanogenic corrinoid protein MtbC1
MASMNRCEDQTPGGNGCIFDPGFAPEPISLAAFRMHCDEDHARSLSTLIESEIIPRMMVAHATQSHCADRMELGTVIGADEVQAFVPLVMQVEADALLVHVEAILGRGVDFETLLVDLLAPTARLLGTLWDDDLCDFVDVTMGLWRLQEVVQEIAGRLPAERPPVAGGRRALFASMPGDQHSFGTIMIDEIFRHEGWLTDRLGDGEISDLLKRVENEWFDIIGLTVSRDCHIARLPSIIVALRNISRNPRVCVMVGGGIISADPGLALQVGADGTARDARHAPKVASELVREREWAAAPYS